MSLIALHYSSETTPNGSILRLRQDVIGICLHRIHGISDKDLHCEILAKSVTSSPATIKTTVFTGKKLFKRMFIFYPKKVC
jgi:hypothetical protein